MVVVAEDGVSASKLVFSYEYRGFGFRSFGLSSLDVLILRRRHAVVRTGRYGLIRISPSIGA